MNRLRLLRSRNEADYPKEDKEAEALLRRVQTPVEAAVGLVPTAALEHRINWGCEG